LYLLRLKLNDFYQLKDERRFFFFWYRGYDL
jgi:hypothetical protein